MLYKCQQKQNDAYVVRSQKTNDAIFRVPLRACSNIHLSYYTSIYIKVKWNSPRSAICRYQAKIHYCGSLFSMTYTYSGCVEKKIAFLFTLGLLSATWQPLYFSDDIVAMR